MRRMQAALALELRRRVALDAGADVEVVGGQRRSDKLLASNQVIHDYPFPWLKESFIAASAS